ncbi:site-specific integrase [Larkinella sp. C7]|uniref:site-specific integrase n=1 Tax=Larkinella sp. C7 TaxID=2576607 RepID=UPI00148619E8|nr:site-specific integrase [Larkinella sp. C7]
MGNVQNFFKKLIIKDDYQKADGTSALYIYVSIDGAKDRIPLKLNWPATHFDKAAGKLLPRSKNDQDYTDYTLMIDTEMGKVNEIFKSYRLSGKTLTMELLIRDYRTFTSRKDFLSFWETEAKERFKRRKIEKQTRDGHLASLNKLKAFWTREVNAKSGRKKNPDTIDGQTPPLPFNNLTPKLLENFRAYLRSALGNAPSTVEKGMKDIRTYVRIALEDKNVFDDPFKSVKVLKPETFPNALTEEQLMSLLTLFEASNTADAWRKVLRHFLFSCFTGLRISDAKTVNHENIKGDWLIIIPVKNRNRYHKVVRVPIHPAARKLVTTSLGRLFDTFSEQHTNRLLDTIGKHVGIDFKMTTHTARHTFGTVFIELGGDVVTLKDYMGHSKLETTMKYVHISEKRKKEKINVFDKLFRKQDENQDVA